MASMGSRMIRIGYNSLMHFTSLANLKKNSIASGARMWSNCKNSTQRTMSLKLYNYIKSQKSVSKEESSKVKEN